MIVTYFHRKSDENRMTNSTKIEQTAIIADVCSIELFRKFASKFCKKINKIVISFVFKWIQKDIHVEISCKRSVFDMKINAFDWIMILNVCHWLVRLHLFNEFSLRRVFTSSEHLKQLQMNVWCFFLYEWRRSVRIQYIQTIRCTDIWMSSYGMQFKVCNFTFHHTHQSNLSSKSALHLVFWQFFFLSCWTRVNWKGARWGDVVKVILLWNIYSLNRIHLQESLCDWPP